MAEASARFLSNNFRLVSHPTSRINNAAAPPHSTVAGSTPAGTGSQEIHIDIVVCAEPENPLPTALPPENNISKSHSRKRRASKSQTKTTVKKSRTSLASVANNKINGGTLTAHKENVSGGSKRVARQDGRKIESRPVPVSFTGRGPLARQQTIVNQSLQPQNVSSNMDVFRFGGMETPIQPMPDDSSTVGVSMSPSSYSRLLPKPVAASTPFSSKRRLKQLVGEESNVQETSELIPTQVQNLQQLHVVATKKGSFIKPPGGDDILASSDTTTQSSSTLAATPFTISTSPIASSTPLLGSSSGQAIHTPGTESSLQLTPTLKTLKQRLASRAHESQDQTGDSGLGSLSQPLGVIEGGIDSDLGATCSSWANSEDSNHALLDAAADKDENSRQSQAEDEEMNTSLTGMYWLNQFAPLPNKSPKPPKPPKPSSNKSPKPQKQLKASRVCCSCSSDRLENEPKRPPGFYKEHMKQALCSRQDRTMSSKQIKEWLVDTCEFYKFHKNCKFWQNAVRHTLSSYDCFVRNRERKTWTFDTSLYRRDTSEQRDQRDMSRFEGSQAGVPLSRGPNPIVLTPLTQNMMLGTSHPATLPATQPFSTFTNNGTARSGLQPILPRPPVPSNITLLNMNNLPASFLQHQQHTPLVVHIPSPSTDAPLLPLSLSPVTRTIPKVPIPALPNANKGVKKVTAAKGRKPKCAAPVKRLKRAKSAGAPAENNVLLQAAIQAGLTNYLNLDDNRYAANSHSNDSGLLSMLVDSCVPDESQAEVVDSSQEQCLMKRSLSTPAILTKKAKQLCTVASQDVASHDENTQMDLPPLRCRPPRKQNLTTRKGRELLEASTDLNVSVGEVVSGALNLPPSLSPVVTSPSHYLNLTLAQPRIEAHPLGSYPTMDTSTPAGKPKKRMEPQASPILQVDFMPDTDNSLKLDDISALHTSPDHSAVAKNQQSFLGEIPVAKNDNPGLSTPPSVAPKVSDWLHIADTSLPLDGHNFTPILDLPDELSFVSQVVNSKMSSPHSSDFNASHSHEPDTEAVYTYPQQHVSKEGQTAQSANSAMLKHSHHKQDTPAQQAGSLDIGLHHLGLTNEQPAQCPGKLMDLFQSCQSGTKLQYIHSQPACTSLTAQTKLHCHSTPASLPEVNPAPLQSLNSSRAAKNSVFVSRRRLFPQFQDNVEQYRSDEEEEHNDFQTMYDKVVHMERLGFSHQSHNHSTHQTTDAEDKDFQQTPASCASSGSTRTAHTQCFQPSGSCPSVVCGEASNSMFPLTMFGSESVSASPQSSMLPQQSFLVEQYPIASGVQPSQPGLSYHSAHIQLSSPHRSQSLLSSSGQVLVKPSAYSSSQQASALGNQILSASPSSIIHRLSHCSPVIGQVKQCTSHNKPNQMDPPQPGQAAQSYHSLSHHSQQYYSTAKNQTQFPGLVQEYLPSQAKQSDWANQDENAHFLHLDNPPVSQAPYSQSQACTWSTVQCSLGAERSAAVQTQLVSGARHNELAFPSHVAQQSQQHVDGQAQPTLLTPQHAKRIKHANVPWSPVATFESIQGKSAVQLQAGSTPANKPVLDLKARLLSPGIITSHCRLSAVSLNSVIQQTVCSVSPEFSSKWTSPSPSSSTLSGQQLFLPPQQIFSNLTGFHIGMPPSLPGSSGTSVTVTTSTVSHPVPVPQHTSVSPAYGECSKSTGVQRVNRECSLSGHVSLSSERSLSSTCAHSAGQTDTDHKGGLSFKCQAYGATSGDVFLTAIHKGTTHSAHNLPSQDTTHFLHTASKQEEEHVINDFLDLSTFTQVDMPTIASSPKSDLLQDWSNSSVSGFGFGHVDAFTNDHNKLSPRPPQLSPRVTYSAHTSLSDQQMEVPSFLFERSPKQHDDLRQHLTAFQNSSGSELISPSEANSVSTFFDLSNSSPAKQPSHC